MGVALFLGILPGIVYSLCAVLLFLFFSYSWKYSLVILFVGLLALCRTWQIQDEFVMKRNLAEQICSKSTKDSKMQGVVERILPGPSTTEHVVIMAIESQGKKLFMKISGMTEVLSVPSGTMLNLVGKCQVPDMLVHDVFPKAMFLAKDNIYLESFRPKSIVPKRDLPDWGHVLPSLLSTWKSSLQVTSDELFSRDTSPLVRGMILGDAVQSQEQEDAFRRAGVSHILVISGFNITLLFVFVRKLLGFLPKRLMFALSMIVIVLFVIMVGPQAAVLRAAAMGILGILALMNHRKASLLHVLLLSVSVLAWLSPFSLTSDPGLALSSLAVAGLVCFHSRIVLFLHWVPDTLALRESLSGTCSALFATLPITIGSFGSLSLVSIITNILIGPLVTPFMAIASLAMLSGVCHVLPFQKLLVEITNGLGSTMNSVALWFSQLPWGVLEIPWLAGQGQTFVLFVCTMLALWRYRPEDCR